MSKIPFGMHQDKEIERTPSGYLRWLVLQDWFEKKYPELLKEAETELGFRDDNHCHFYDGEGY